MTRRLSVTKATLAEQVAIPIAARRRVVSLKLSGFESPTYLTEIARRAEPEVMADIAERAMLEASQPPHTIRQVTDALAAAEVARRLS